jgi:murein DD-endopeptidase MepM/ murein hydrolase activator NlpD
VQWVVGEFGIDEHVIGGGPHHGYLVPLGNRPDEYCAWLDRAIAGIADPRIHSYQVFTYDYSKPWDSFDLRAVRRQLETYSWTHVTQSHPVTFPVYAPVVSKPETPSPRALVWPAKGIVTQRFGENVTEYMDAFGGQGHNGIDIGAAIGTPVVAIAAGEVAWTGADPDYGNYIRVHHPAHGLHSFYAHLDKIMVQVGQTVQAGQQIATLGNTGNSTGPHLHFEIRTGTRDGYGQAAYGHTKGRIDPEAVFPVLGSV